MSRERAATIQRLLGERRWADASGELERWTRDHPRHAPGWWWRSRCLERLGQPEAALECARTARALAPGEARLEELVSRLEKCCAGLSQEPDHTLVEPGREDSEPGQTRVETAATGGDPDETVLGQPGSAPDEGENATAHEVASPSGSDRAAQRWSIGDVIEGRYEVRSRARGGMGEVYFVVDRELGLEVAVKTPLPQVLGTKAGRARFLREAEAWIALGLHPNIVTAFYVRDIAGLPRLFIEYVDGGTLEQWLSRNREAAISQRLDLAIQIAAGMEHAHTFAWTDEDGHDHRGLVHRDLKPANVLLGSDGAARVTDFGLVGRGAFETESTAGDGMSAPDVPVEATLVELGASAKSSSSVWGTVTLGGRVMGSPPYMAPEQWEGAHAAGAPADIYAFGCVLYEVICGQRPFTPEPRYATASRAIQLRAWEHLHRTRPPADPRRLVGQLDGELAELILACLAKAPGQRPASFAVLSPALRAAYLRTCGRQYPRSPPRPGELLADSLCNRGVSYASLGHTERATVVWRQALEVEPQHVAASFNLALAEWRSGRASDAELIRRVGGALRPGSAAWRDLLLLGRAQLCAGDYAAATETLRKAVASSGRASEAVKDLIVACAALAHESADPGLWGETAALLDDSEGWLAHDPAALIGVAVARQRLGDEEAGQRLWQAARQWRTDLPHELQRAAERLLPGATVVVRSASFAGRIAAAALRQDGRLGLIGGEDGRIAVWRPEAGVFERTLQRTGPRVRCLAIVPGHELALSASGNQAVTVWDLAAGSERRTLQAHTGFLNALSVDGAGATAAGVGSAGSVFVWDLASGQRIMAHETHSGFAQCVALAADGSLVASGGNDGVVCVVVVAEGRSMPGWSAHPGGVSALDLDPAGRWLLSGGEDGALRLWDLADRRCVSTLEGHDGAIRLVALDHERQRALSASSDGTLRVWDLAAARLLKVERLGEPVAAGAAASGLALVVVGHGVTLSQLRLVETPRHDPAWSVAVTVSASEADRRTREFREHLAAGRQLLDQQDLASAFVMIDRARSVSGYERAREALELETELGATLPRGNLRAAWPDHELGSTASRLTAIAVSPVGQRALTTDRARRLVVWHWLHGTELASIEAPAVAVAASFVGSARTAVTAHLDNVLRFWDLDAGVCSLQVGGHDARIHAVAVDPHGEIVLSADGGGIVHAWDGATGAARYALRGHLGAVTAAAVRADGRAAVSGGDDGTVVVWDLDSGDPLGELSGHGEGVVALSWSADGRTLLSAGKDGTVRLWDAHAGRCLRTLEIAEGPSCAVLSADARHALVGQSSGELAVWNLRDRRPVVALERHLGSIAGAHFTPGDRRVVSAGRDGSARVTYLDWQPRVRPYAEWDEAARPHLEIFLSRHTPRGVSGAPWPEWGEQDVRRLLSELRDAGLGWLRPDGVRRRLAELASSFHGLTPPRLAAAASTTSYTRGTRRSWLRRGVAAVALVVPLIFGLTLVHDWRQLHLDPAAAKERRERDLIARHGPAQVARKSPCDPNQLDRYIRDFVEFTDRPGDWVRANYCLEALADPRAVDPLLDMLRPQPSDPVFTELQIGSDPRQILSQLRTAMTGGFNTKASVQSMLARFGDSAVTGLVEALADREPAVRATAARALALGDSETSHRALVDHARDPRPAVRQAVASQLESLACSRAVDLEQALAVAENLAQDPDTRVRREVARRAGIFAGSKGRALLARLAEDPDPEVSAAARRHLLSR